MHLIFIDHTKFSNSKSDEIYITLMPKHSVTEKAALFFAYQNSH